MFWKGGLLRFGLKNFKQHMNIHTKLTLRGLIRRHSRIYPRTYKAIRTVLIAGGLYTSIAMLIPGCELPLQETIKTSSYKLSAVLFRLWDYNIFTNQPHQYMIKLNELIMLAMENQIYNQSFLGQLYGEIREVMVENKKGIKTAQYLDLLLYSEIQLQSIIRFSNRSLLSPIIYDHYQWLYQTLTQKLPKTQITLKEDSHVKLFYTVVQYLLNFGQKQQIRHILSSFDKLISPFPSGEKDKKQGNQREYFGYWIAKRAFEQKELLQNLKKIYEETEDVQVRTTIMHIFQQLDQIYAKLDVC